ncbi:MAG: hypothetical protein M1837_006969 [Sclerophora amabilis]|nr:MAG: hypothetical protein M1837_006969 [Sclerophora amabilis]
MDTDLLKTATGYIVSSLFCTIGIRAIVDPVGYSNDFGIPATAPTRDYVPVVGGRNLALGLGAATMTFRGERAAAGVLMCTAVVIGVVDTWISRRRAGRMNSSAWSHVIGSGLVAAAGGWLTA